MRVFVLTLLLLSLTSAYSQTLIGDTLRNDTTLTAIGNPYHLVSDMFIPDNVSLTLEAGTYLYIDSSQTVAGRITVAGSLLIQGTADSPVVIEGDSGSPFSPSWRGINFSGNQAVLDVNFAEIRYAAETWIQGDVDVRINNSLFFGCGNGLYANESTFFQYHQIRNCRFEGNLTGLGGYFLDADSCHFEDNFIGGEFLYSTIRNCTARNNRTPFQLYEGANLYQSEVYDNDLGIYAFFTQGNMLDSIQILDNRIWNNGVYQIQFMGKKLDTLAYVQNNVICGDSVLIRFDSIPEFDLSENCWCESDTLLIASKFRWTNTSGPADTSLFIPFQEDCLPGLVYPGDTDRDRLVDMRDILSIGLLFGSTGPARSNASNGWIGQVQPDWLLSSPLGANAKYADCDGSGQINALDTLAIHQNYRFRHRSFKNGGGSPLRIRPTQAPSSYSAGDTVTYVIEWGNMDSVIQQAYGLVFSLAYDTSQWKQNSLLVQYQNSWFGTLGQDLLTMVYHDTAAGRLDLGMVRTNQANSNGFGQLGSIIIVLDDDLSKRSIPIAWDVLDVLSVDSAGNTIPVEARVSTLISNKTTARSPYFSPTVRAFPNPNKTGLYMLKAESPWGPGSFQVFDASGNLIAQGPLKPSGRSQTVDLSLFSAGAYLLRLRGLHLNQNLLLMKY